MTRLSRVDSYPSTAVKCDLFVLVQNKKRCGISLFTTWPRNLWTKGWIQLSRRINIYMRFYKIFILYCQCFMDIFGIAGAQKLEYHFWKHFIPLFHTYAETAVKNYYECALHTEQGFSLNFHPVMYNSGDVNLTLKFSFSEKATKICAIFLMGLTFT